MTSTSSRYRPRARSRRVAPPARARRRDRSDRRRRGTAPRRGRRDEPIVRAKSRLLNESGEDPGARWRRARCGLATYSRPTMRTRASVSRSKASCACSERRRSLANLGKLVEALVAAAVTPKSGTRAHRTRDVAPRTSRRSLEGARGAAREATETGAVASDLGAAWLTLELVASKLGDAALREEALAGRAELAIDPTWRGLLLVDVAALAAASGDVDKAIETATKARDIGAGATWAATTAIRAHHARRARARRNRRRPRPRAHPRRGPPRHAPR